MKTKLLLLHIFLISFTSVRAGTTIVDSIISGGEYRSFRIYVPDIYDGSIPVPMIFNLHGFTSNAQQQEFYGNFLGIADTANFILVHPQGKTVSALGTTGPGWTCFDPITTTPHKDLQFLESLLDHIIENYNINTNRVYSTGMSNGGFMSYDLACFLSDRITAIASVTGTMSTFHLATCNPNKPMPIMQIHGTADAVVNYNGSMGIIGVDSLVNFFVSFNNCNPTAVFTQVPNINISDNCTAEHYVYNGGDANSSVELYKVIGGDHTWPGSPPVTLATTNRDFNASQEIWRFFSQYNFPAGITENDWASNIRISPNPASDVVYFSSNNAIIIQAIMIADLSGRVVFQSEKNLATQNYKIQSTNFSEGMYISTIVSNKGTTSKKLIVN